MSDELEVDQLVADRYRVLALLGAGGMGSVYCVQQIYLRKQFALKLLNPTKSETVWRRFQKEAQAASALDHPGLIKVHDFGTINERQPFFVMDYFDGQTLAERLKEQGPMSVDDMLDIFTKVCSTLAYAHNQGIVHRDIKPSNIMISRAEVGECDVRLLDFGIAKFNNFEDVDLMALTRTGEIIGTPYYMSPEQCIGAPMDRRSDIYSLGAVIYEMLTGAPPFFGANPLMIMMQHQSEKLPPLGEASLGRSFPSALNSLLERMMEKNPDQRYQDLLDVRNDLACIRSGKQLAMPKRKASPETRKPYWLTVVVYAFTAICLLVGTVYGVTSIVRMTVSTAPKVNASVTVIPETYSVPKPTVRSTGFYSRHADPHTRLFNFPPDPRECPGMLLLDKSVQAFSATQVFDKAHRIAATGDITVDPFKPFGLYPSFEAAEQPHLFSRFRPDELWFVSFKNVMKLGNSFPPTTFEEIARLRSLQALDLAETEGVTAANIRTLNALPNLTYLDCGNDGLSGADLLQLKRLPQLKQLSVRALNHAWVVLPELAKTGLIDDLNVRRGDVPKNHFSPIFKLSRLRALDVSGLGDTVDDAVIARLVALKHVEILSILGDKVTVASIPSFQQMHLKVLAIDCDKWPSVDEQRLRMALKGCQVCTDKQWQQVSALYRQGIP
jgi:serine/threonine protein kinase